MAIAQKRNLIQTSNGSGAFRRMSAFFERCWQVNAPITVFGVATSLFTLAAIVALFSDPRVIVGQPAWLKPVKFGLSIAMYSFSIIWLLGFVRAERPWIKKTLKAFTWIVIVVFTAEIVPITIQVLRGTRSHFNVATSFDQALLAIMAVSISVLWAANLVLAVILLRQRFEDRVFGWSLRFALIVTIVGMATGYLMTRPTPDQIASWEAGAPVTIVGAHSVGVPDGGPGMPVTGWSTEGGDLRIPHFVGLHALQIIPLVGGWISRRRGLKAGQRLALVWTASLWYFGLVALLTWQAMRGQPLLSPDALTLWAFAGLVAAAVAAVAWTLSPLGRNSGQGCAAAR